MANFGLAVWLIEFRNRFWSRLLYFHMCNLIYFSQVPSSLKSRQKPRRRARQPGFYSCSLRKTFVIVYYSCLFLQSLALWAQCFVSLDTNFVHVQSVTFRLDCPRSSPWKATRLFWRTYSNIRWLLQIVVQAWISAHTNLWCITIL